MKVFPILGSLMLLLGQGGVMAAEPAAGTNAAPAIGPRIQFSEPIFDFGQARSGESVTHTFTFTNTGDVTLEIANVAPGCQCTTAGDWTRKVEPGHTGTIPIKFDSGTGVGHVGKSITVMSTDRSQPQVTLMLTGTLWRPVEVAPQFANMIVVTDSDPSPPVRVMITNNLPEAMELSGLQVTNKEFKAELKTVIPGKVFEVLVEAVPPFVIGPHHGIISLKTNSKEVPTIDITGFVTVQPAVGIMPDQIMLPPGSPLSPQLVMVRNNGANPMTLSNAIVNIPGASVEVKELSPGKQFNLVVTFAPDFKLPPAETVELTVQTSNPKYAQLHIPIHQRPMPVINRGVTPAPPMPSPAPKY